MVAMKPEPSAFPPPGLLFLPAEPNGGMARAGGRGICPERVPCRREDGDRQGEGAELGSLGSCHYSLGEYRQAIDLYTQALVIARDIGDRQNEGARPHRDLLGIARPG
jgi:tetratricopeptide (TPR) repeat protein